MDAKSLLDLQINCVFLSPQKNNIMNLENIMAITGLPGLYTLVANKNNGLIVADLDTGKKRFVSSRKHQFSPLETIAIYTDTDSKELKKVFQSMIEQSEDTPPISPKASKADIVDYFEDIIPDYDRDRVHIGDMKKILKWYFALDEKNLLEPDTEK